MGLHWSRGVGLHWSGGGAALEWGLGLISQSVVLEQEFFHIQ